MSEIAETLQMTVGAVKLRVHRARLFLRSRLVTYLNLPEPAESKASLSSVGGAALSRVDAPARGDRGSVRQRGGAAPRYASRSWSRPSSTPSPCPHPRPKACPQPRVRSPRPPSRSCRPGSPRQWPPSLLHAPFTRTTE